MSDEVVRIATINDLSEVMSLLAIMHAEGGIMPLDEMEAQSMFMRAFKREGGILGVIGEPGDIKAMIFLLIAKYWYTRTNHLEELFNFVRPDVRFESGARNDYAGKTVEFAKKCSDEIGIPLVIGVLTNRRMQGKVRLYRKKLGVPAGAYFVYNSKWKNDEPANEDFWKDPFPKRGPRSLDARKKRTERYFIRNGGGGNRQQGQ